MGKLQIAKYAAVFAAGAFAVLGAIGLNTLLTPNSPSAVSLEQSTSTSAQGREGQTQRLVESEDSSPVSETSDLDSQEQADSAPMPTEEPAEIQRPASETNQTTDIASLQRSTMATIQGTVASIRDEDEFVLADESGSVRVYTGKTLFTVEQGQTVSVRGFVDNSPILELYAQEIRFVDGSTLMVEHWD